MSRDVGSSGGVSTIKIGAGGEKRPLQIVAIGFSSRARTMLEMFFSANRETPCVLVETLDQAEAGLFDLDGPDAKQQFEDYRQLFSCPVLVMSVRDPKLQGVVWVPKPVQPKQLMSALAQVIAQRDLAKAIQSSPGRGAKVHVLPTSIQQPAVKLSVHKADEEDVPDTVRAAELTCCERRRHPSYGNLVGKDYADPVRRSKCFYDPREYFQGALESALAEAERAGKPLRIVLDGVDKGLVVFPDQHRVQCDVREQLLRNICMMPGGSSAIKTEFLDADTGFDANSPEPRLQFESNLLWKVALWSSFGRLPLGTDPERPVQLKFWPNFTRIFIPHHALQIAALWAQRPVSLLETASVLEIEDRFVFSFYSAAHAIGAISSVAGDHRPTGDGRRRDGNGLFRRLLSYLGACE